MATFTPGNVIVTAEGPRLVDWSGPVRAPAGWDLAVSHIVLTELAAEVSDNPERPRAVNDAAQSEYARLTGVSPPTLVAAIEAYLPIVRVLVIISGVMPSLRERLLQRVEQPCARRTESHMATTAGRETGPQSRSCRQIKSGERMLPGAGYRLAADRRHRGRWRRRGRRGHRLRRRRGRVRSASRRKQRRRNHDGKQRGFAKPPEGSLLFVNVVHPFLQRWGF